MSQHCSRPLSRPSACCCEDACHLRGIRLRVASSITIINMPGIVPLTTLFHYLCASGSPSHHRQLFGSKHQRCYHATKLLGMVKKFSCAHRDDAACQVRYTPRWGAASLGWDCYKLCQSVLAWQSQSSDGQTAMSCAAAYRMQHLQYMTTMHLHPHPVVQCITPASLLTPMAIATSLPHSAQWNTR